MSSFVSSKEIINSTHLVNFCENRTSRSLVAHPYGLDLACLIYLIPMPLLALGYIKLNPNFKIEQVNLRKCLPELYYLLKSFIQFHAFMSFLVFTSLSDLIKSGVEYTSV